MEDCKFYELLLDLPFLSVSSVSFDSDKLVVTCHSQLGEGICPCCKKKTTKVNQRYHRSVSDLPISGSSVVLNLEVRQFICLDCNRTFSERFDFVSESTNTTHRQAKWVFMLCEKQPISQVAALLGMGYSQVAHIYQLGAESLISACDPYKSVRNLGIDEIALRKGHGDYACVLVDLDRGCVIDMLPFRDKERLIAHFQAKGEAFLQQIEHISCDMWDGYITSSKALFPNAKIVIDRFHVAMHLNAAVDEQRKEIRKTNKDVEVFKGIKWALLKDPKRLTVQDEEKLSKAFEQSSVLEEIYEIKNTFKAIFDAQFEYSFACQQIEHWLDYVELIANKHLNKFVKTFNNYKSLICNYFGTLLSNGVTEGCNNLIKTIRRMSFGMPNFENLKLRVLAYQT